MIYEVHTLVEKIKNDYFYILNYKGKSLSVIIKEFLNKSLIEQIHFISIILLFEDDYEIQTIAGLLYDMISNDSMFIKYNIDYNFIYSNLHWSLQKKLKIINKKFNNFKKIDILNIEDNLSYEKRINMLNVSENVKNKAYDKLKEISNK